MAYIVTLVETCIGTVALGMGYHSTKFMHDALRDICVSATRMSTSTTLRHRSSLRFPMDKTKIACIQLAGTSFSVSQLLLPIRNTDT